MIFTQFLPLLGLVSLAIADPIRMPLIRKNMRRQDNGDTGIDLGDIKKLVDLDKMAASADFLRARYGFKPVSNHTKRGQTVGIPVVNQVSSIASCVLR